MRLIDCFIPLLAFLRHFQNQPSGDTTSVQLQLDGLLTEALNTAQTIANSGADVQEALFAVVALTDEVLLAATWSGSREWARHLLQKRYFDVSNAGNTFFSRLEQLGPQQVEVREVYIYCLSLGFAGRYGYDHNTKALANIKQTNLLQVLQVIKDQRKTAGLSPETEKLMFPDGYLSEATAEAEKNAGQISRWGWKFSALTINVILIPLIVLCVLYGIYHLIIWQLASAILEQVK